MICCIFFIQHIFAQDAIIFRDGRVKSVKIIQTNNDKTMYKDSGDEMADEEFVDNKTVFMLKFKTRGNVVFNSEGERILTTSESTKIPKDAIVIYFKDGREVPAYSLTMDENAISFKTKKAGGILKKSNEKPISAPKSEVFMISYPDGTRDILTNIAIEEQRKREEDEAKLKAQQEAEAKAAEEAAAALEEEKAMQEARKATIITSKGIKMRVWVYGDDGKNVSYKKENSVKAPMFMMNKSRIRKIQY